MATDVCDKDGDVIVRGENFRRHQNLHTQALISCDMCSKKFTRSDNWDNHKKKHSTFLLTFDCDQCYEKFGKNTT